VNEVDRFPPVTSFICQQPAYLCLGYGGCWFHEELCAQSGSGNQKAKGEKRQGFSFLRLGTWTPPEQETQSEILLWWLRNGPSKRQVHWKKAAFIEAATLGKPAERQLAYA
jgi:hypothetical protein